MRQKWTRCDFPPYAGQWWAVTLHDTVEMVDVSLKSPKHLGKAESAACGERGAEAYPIDPYLYQFGDGCTTNSETVAKRRWLWWMPVVPPDRPRDMDVDVAGDPAPKEGESMGKSVEHHLLEKTMAEYAPATDFSVRRHGGQKMRGPHKMSQQAGQCESKAAPKAQCSNCGEAEGELKQKSDEAKETTPDWAAYQKQQAAEARFQAEMQAKAQDEMDQRDASAYEPVGKDGPPPPPQPPKMTPGGMVVSALKLARDFIALPEATRELELGKLSWLNPSLASLVKQSLKEFAKEAGPKEKTG